MGEWGRKSASMEGKFDIRSHEQERTERAQPTRESVTNKRVKLYIYSRRAFRIYANMHAPKLSSFNFPSRDEDIHQCSSQEREMYKNLSQIYIQPTAIHVCYHLMPDFSAAHMYCMPVSAYVKDVHHLIFLLYLVE